MGEIGRRQSLIFLCRQHLDRAVGMRHFDPLHTPSGRGLIDQSVDLGGEVLFGCCDANVHGIQKVSDAKQACAQLKGGGGTNFCPVFEELEAMGRTQRPHLIIFLTDGDGPAPDRAPNGMHVIWVIVGQHGRIPYTRGGQEIGWGEQIVVKEPGGKSRAA